MTSTIDRSMPIPTASLQQVGDTSISWSSMTAIEPRLLDLEQWALRQHFSWQKYEELKARLSLLVGWNVRHPQLGTSQAWNAAIGRLLPALERKATCGRRAAK